MQAVLQRTRKEKRIFSESTTTKNKVAMQRDTGMSNR
jgi:hypothetical protein